MPFWYVLLGAAAAAVLSAIGVALLQSRRAEAPRLAVLTRRAQGGLLAVGLLMIAAAVATTAGAGGAFAVVMPALMAVPLAPDTLRHLRTPGDPKGTMISK